MSAKRKTKEEPVSFETSLEDLEAIARRLDGEALGVEEAMAEYEKGLEALRRCRAILDEAERRLEVLVREEGGKAVTKPFVPEGEEGEGGGTPAPARKKAAKKPPGGGSEGGEPQTGFLF